MRKLLPDPGPRAILRRIKSDAAAAKREFSLTLDDLKSLIHQPCHYCGATDCNTMTVKSETPGLFVVQNYKYNGVDRIDNNIGYRLTNCVPCCIICNRAKNSMPYEEFMDWIESLVKYNNGTRVSVSGRDSPPRQSN